MTGKVLKDITRSGKERPWRERKTENISYADLLQILHYKKAHRVKECGEVLRFVADDEGRLKLAQTWFCKSRLCPLCNWRRAMKNSNQLEQILTTALQTEPHGRFLFLTLTTENTDGDSLKAEIKAMGVAAHKLFKYKKVAKNVLGYVRSTEVTVNDQGMESTYHQHMHVLLFVKSTYFFGPDNYINQAEWTAFWKRAMQLDYTPIVNVEAVKPNRKSGKSSLLASAKETAKYQVKSKDILTNNQLRDLKVVDDLEKGLAGSRQISYGGLLKKLRKELQLEDEENLINLNDDDQNIDESVRTVIAKWNYERQNYFVE